MLFPLTLLVLALLASKVTAQPVLATSASETEPFGSGNSLVWTQARQEFPLIHLSLGDVWLRVGRHRPMRLNPPGTLAASGGISGNTAVLQVTDRGDSGLRLVDLASGRSRKPPGLDTRLYEWRGTLSGQRLLFGRIDFVGHRFQIVLHDLRSGKERILSEVRGHGAYSEPGQIAGRYAVWANCPDNLCSVFRYDLRTGHVASAPNPDAYTHTLYAPAVDERGTVYYARGNLGCGSGVALMRWRPGTAPSVLVRLPLGIDLRFSSTTKRAGGTRVLFDRYDCARKTWDVYAVDDP